MIKLISKTMVILKGRRGESLMEGLMSLLVFTILIAAVTMMIMTSLRITNVSTDASNNRQTEANAVLAGDSGETALTIVSEAVEFIVDGSVIEVPVITTSTANYTAFEPGGGGTP